MLYYTCILQYQACAVYIISALYSLLWALHVCKVCPFTALFTTPHGMHVYYVCRYVAMWWKVSESGAAGGERSEPPGLLTKSALLQPLFTTLLASFRYYSYTRFRFQLSDLWMARTTPYSMHVYVCRYVTMWWKVSESSTAGGKRNEPPCLYIKWFHTFYNYL